MEVGVLVGVGDDAHLEGVARGFAYGEAYAVDGHAAFIDAEIAAAGHGAVEGVAEGEDPRAVGLFDVDALGGEVHVALYDVAVQTAVHGHGALDVYFVAYAEEAEVGAAERLLHGGDDVAGAVGADNGEAYAVVGEALVDVELVGEGALEGEVEVLLFLTDGYDGGRGFYYS